jgi:hypothetical protein
MLTDIQTSSATPHHAGATLSPVSEIETLADGRAAIERKLGTLQGSEPELDVLLDGLDAAMIRMSFLKPQTPREISALVNAAAYHVDLLLNGPENEDGEARAARGGAVERILASIKGALPA